MGTEDQGSGLGNAFVALALGAPAVGAVILAIGMLVPSLDAPWVATLVAFPLLVVALLVLFPLTQSEK